MRRFAVLTVTFVWVAAVISGCSSAARDISAPDKALLGHWENIAPGTNADVYYGDDTVYYSGGSTKPVKTSYKVISQDTDGFTLEVRYGQETGDPTRIGFSEDRDEMIVYPASAPELLKYEYVDDSQSP